MRENLLLDSNILVDYLRDLPEAVAYFRSLETAPSVSAITVAELYAGVREGSERSVLDNLVGELNVVAVTFEIAVLGGLLRRRYLKSHRLEVVDAIIAATADRIRADIVTRNRKHFPMFEQIVTPY